MTSATRSEPWPAWANAILVAIAALAILATVPWMLMWTAMTASCMPMMQQIPGMMR